MADIDEVHIDPALTVPDRIILQNLQADIDALRSSSGGESNTGEKSDLKKRSGTISTGEQFRLAIPALQLI